MESDSGVFVSVPDGNLSPFELGLKKWRVSLLSQVQEALARISLPITTENRKRLFSGDYSPDLDFFIFCADRAGFDVRLVPTAKRRFKLSRKKTGAARVPEQEQDEQAELIKPTVKDPQTADCLNCAYFTPEDIRENCTAFSALLPLDDLPRYCERFTPK